MGKMRKTRYDRGEGVKKKSKNCVTYFTNDPGDVRYEGRDRMKWEMGVYSLAILESVS